MVRRKALSIDLGDQWACWASWARAYKMNSPVGVAKMERQLVSAVSLQGRFWLFEQTWVVNPLQANQAYGMRFFVRFVCEPPLLCQRRAGRL